MECKISNIPVDQADSSEPCWSRRAFIASSLVLTTGVLSSGCTPGVSSTGEFVSNSNSFDIVVVGGGAAGMTAAIAAFDAGAQRILVLEKAAFTGGNSCLASSGMNAAGSFYQQQAGIEDTPELFAQDTFEGGHRLGDFELVSYMCAQSGDAIMWLAGMGIVLNQVVHAAGAELARCHRPFEGTAIGATLIPGLEDQLKKRGIQVYTSMQATSLHTDAIGAVIGVGAVPTSQGSGSEEQSSVAESETVFFARAVVLACGGLASDPETVRRWRPDLAGYASTNQSSCTGDGYKLAAEAGAALVDMEFMQVHATVSRHKPENGMPSMPIAEALRTAGAILVNTEGQRFIDETGARETVAAGIAAQEDGMAWLVFDDGVVSLNPAVDSTYRPNGLVVDASDVAALAQQIDVPAEALEVTAQECVLINQGQILDLFKRSTPTAPLTGPLHAICVVPGVHYEMGGVRIDTASRALDANGVPISGLFAAGEVTGGIHGANRISGNGVCDAVVFGRNAGVEAAAYLDVSAKVEPSSMPEENETLEKGEQ